MAEESVDELIRQLETLRIQEDTLLRQIIQARARESQQRQDTDGLIGRPVTDRDRVGTVTKITRKRVFLQTDNGVNTNRAPENLQRLS
jgi:hypothetical protein